MVHPKCEIIMALPNYSLFQYCDSNIEFFSIVLFKVIAFNPLCFI